MDPLPYNITISAQSLAIIYEPNHDIDSTPESSWNVTYTHGTALTLYGNQEVGNNSLQTTFIVSMKITWIGTAAYLYRNTTTSKPYNIFIDDGDAIAQIYPRNNLLAAVTGLPYRSHTITLNHVHINDVLALHYAVLTIGVGYEGSSFQIQNQSVPAVLDGKPNNAFFEFWNITPLALWIPSPLSLEEFLPNGSRQPTPPFFMRGFVGADGGPKLATLIPGFNGESSKATVFNDYSPLWDFDQVLYWESGLDRDKTYTVQIHASNASQEIALLFHTLDIVDGGPNPKKQLPVGSIAGIAVGTGLAVIILAIFALCWSQRRKRAALEIADASNITPFIRTKAQVQVLNVTPLTSLRRRTLFLPRLQIQIWIHLLASMPVVTHHALRHLRRFRSFTLPAPIRETDAGPATLPPEYDHSWASNANLPTPVPVSGSQRRALPIPPGPGPEPPIPVDKVEHEDSEQTVDPSSNSS
ncbi:hypothetical protein Moror_9419 [Moniliophthora roreri MCA 2997]|uniref:Transmembrane protein n=1 Tax=Moniliophthora roreri (strain MCA 2997) TaxID=1381753 RepID=V2WGN7_MONRO|nr:hypothetical protein Moror_9419 [Moniliophthora roreri MCA 2997]